MKGKKESITLTLVPETRFIFTRFFSFAQHTQRRKEKRRERKHTHTHTHHLWEFIEKAPLLNTIELNPIQCILFVLYSIFRLVFRFVSLQSLNGLNIEMALR